MKVYIPPKASYIAAIALLKFVIYWAYPLAMLSFGLYLLIFFQPPEEMAADFGTKGLTIIAALVIIIGAGMFKPHKLAKRG